MGNMSYCRFENTLKDLTDCKNALQDEGGIENIMEDASQYEKEAVIRLVKMCRDIAEEFGDELDELLTKRKG